MPGVQCRRISLAQGSRYIQTVTGMSGDLLSGLPDALRRLLGAPPVMEKKLLELSVGWTGPSPGQARMAGALRLFVIT